MKPTEKQGISCQNGPQAPLYQCHQRGLIPGPHESKSAFFNRVALSPPQTPFNASPFHITPDWVPIKEENKGLSTWEAATTWIEEHPNHTRSCQIQLKTSSPFSFYSKKEALSHELVHAARLMFDEPLFEEILAFRTSSHPLRRYLSPLFSIRHALISFFLLTGLSWIFLFLCFYLNYDELSPLAPLLPFSSLSFYAIKLMKAQRLFSSAINNISSTFQQPQKALTAMLSLTDKEIQRFAHSSPTELHHYILEQKETSLRLKQLYDYLTSDAVERPKQCEAEPYT